MIENLPVQILDPFGINVAIENNPMSFSAFPAHVVDDFTEDMGKKTVIPFSSSRIECPIKCFLVHRFGIDDVSDTLDAVKSLKSSEQDFPGICFASARRSNHHETVLDLLNLVKLEDLCNPAFTVNQTTFNANFEDLLPELVEINRHIIDTREDIGQEAARALGVKLNMRIITYLVRSVTSSATSLGTMVSVTL